MFAIQGPRSVELLQPLVDVDLQSMRYYRGAQVAHSASGRPAPRRHHQPHRLHGRRRLRAEPRRRHRPGRVGSAHGTRQAAGRRARRARRPRHAAARSRHAALRPRTDRSRSIRSRPAWASPATWWATTFPAATPCCASKASRRSRSASGWNWPAARAARQGCPILADGRPVGEVTSGTLSPTLRKPIAMGYVGPEFAQPGTELQIDIRGRMRAGPRRGTAVLPPQQERNLNDDDPKNSCTARRTNGSASRPTPAGRRSPRWASRPSPSRR